MAWMICKAWKNTGTWLSAWSWQWRYCPEERGTAAPRDSRSGHLTTEGSSWTAAPERSPSWQVQISRSWDPWGHDPSPQLSERPSNSSCAEQCYWKACLQGSEQKSCVLPRQLPWAKMQTPASPVCQRLAKQLPCSAGTSPEGKLPSPQWSSSLRHGSALLLVLLLRPMASTALICKILQARCGGILDFGPWSNNVETRTLDRDLQTSDTSMRCSNSIEQNQVQAVNRICNGLTKQQKDTRSTSSPMSNFQANILHGVV